MLKCLETARHGKKYSTKRVCFLLLYEVLRNSFCFRNGLASHTRDMYKTQCMLY
jgi:hypothetical protein